MSRARIGIALAAAALVVLLFVLLRPGGDDAKETSPGATTTVPTASVPTTAPTAPATPPAARMTIVVRDAKPVGGIQRFSAKKGAQVVVVVRSDVADEIHVHGYDLKGDVAPGQPVRIGFEATIAGRFEIELEGRGTQIAELTVEP